MILSNYLEKEKIEIDNYELSILIKSLFCIYSRLALDKSLIIGKNSDPCFPMFFYNSILVVKTINKYKKL